MDKDRLATEGNGENSEDGDDEDEKSEDEEKEIKQKDLKTENKVDGSKSSLDSEVEEVTAGKVDSESEEKFVVNGTKDNGNEVSEDSGHENSEMEEEEDHDVRLVWLFKCGVKAHLNNIQSFVVLCACTFKNVCILFIFYSLF